jgi:hypothetical protein
MARFWGDPADGEICDACDKPITQEQLIMDGIVSMLSDKKLAQFHVRCFQFWGYGEARTEDVDFTGSAPSRDRPHDLLGWLDLQRGAEHR